MREFADRVAVVTGGASGIGRGMAESFAARGMKLVLGDIEKPELDRTVGELAASGAEVVGVACDVARAESVAELAERALDAYGAVHVLCNNAGVGAGGPAAIWESPLEDWNWVMGVNLMGVIHGIRSFMPIMIEQGTEGHIVNTASMAGLAHGRGIYGVTKHAVVALSESLYSELRLRGSKLGVSVLCPGWVNTRIIEAERNRPEAPRPDPGELGPEFEAMREAVIGLIRSGLDPRKVGDTVVEAMEDQRFYVLTHPNWKNMIQSRMESILEGRDPIGVPPPAGESLAALDPRRADAKDDTP